MVDLIQPASRYTDGLEIPSSRLISVGVLPSAFRAFTASGSIESLRPLCIGPLKHSVAVLFKSITLQELADDNELLYLYCRECGCTLQE